MERRVFLAIGLSILVLDTYQVFIAPRPAPPPPGTTEQQAGPVAPTATAPSSEPLEQPAAPRPATVVSEATEREITVRTGRAEVVLTNRGGRVLHWRLTDYLDEGTPVDLVPSNLPASQPRPFSLQVDAAETTQWLNEALYKVASTGGSTIDATREPATVVFEFEDVTGLRARKEFRFEPDSYLATFSASVTEGQQPLTPWVLWGPGLGDVGARSAGGSFFSGNYVQAPQAIYHQNGEVVRVAADALAAEPYTGDFLFAGIDNHFVVTAVKPGRARATYTAVTLPAGADAQHKFVSLALQVEPGSPPVQFFVGGKEFEALRAVHPQLVYTINFGMFQWLVVPLLQALKWVHEFSGNYGWSIIILTILINLVMFPLRHKSLVSMRKMQLIQPEVKAIQDRYSHLKMTDPARQKMNTEVMNLYREKGANPAAGCVPMLLTMPVLFAFYSLLSQSIELRGAPFLLWIHDLSQKDPYYVTPILMGVTMFWQQWMAPTTIDQTQQRVMMVMPVVFTLMFLGFPSGLAIYYLVSNLFQIGQQYFTNRVIGPPPRPVPAVDRRTKSAGAGRTAAAEAKK